MTEAQHGINGPEIFHQGFQTLVEYLNSLGKHYISLEPSENNIWQIVRILPMPNEPSMVYIRRKQYIPGVRWKTTGKLNFVDGEKSSFTTAVKGETAGDFLAQCLSLLPLLA